MINVLYVFVAMMAAVCVGCGTGDGVKGGPPSSAPSIGAFTAFLTEDDLKMGDELAPIGEDEALRVLHTGLLQRLTAPGEWTVGAWALGDADTVALSDCGMQALIAALPVVEDEPYVTLDVDLDGCLRERLSALGLGAEEAHERLRFAVWRGPPGSEASRGEFEHRLTVVLRDGEAPAAIERRRIRSEIVGAESGIWIDRDVLRVGPDAATGREVYLRLEGPREGPWNMRINAWTRAVALEGSD